MLKLGKGESETVGGALKLMLELLKYLNDSLHVVGLKQFPVSIMV